MSAGRGAVIVHHPLPLSEHATSGSQVRPSRMATALESIGFEVELVCGYSRERGRRMGAVAEQIAAGRRFAFAYAESSTTALALNDPHHLPLHPLQDQRFFRGLRRAAVPIGLFYRDVYWRFDVYRRAVPPMRRTLAVAAYHLEWRQYRATIEHLFLPSLRMADHLPSPWPGAVHALPPGGDPVAAAVTLRRPGPLRLLYVGSVATPLYDLGWVLAAVAGRTDLTLVVCCRPEERAGLGEVPAGVAVVHEVGPGLSRLYAEADVTVSVFPPHPYRDFAVPVKLFESVGHGVPVIVNAGTAAGDAVLADELGWVVEGPAALAALLDRLLRDPTTVPAARARVRASRSKHTWAARAETLATSMGAAS